MSTRALSLLHAAALLSTLSFFSGCATYSDVLESAHEAATGGDWPAAEARLNDLLGVDSRAEIPATLDSDQTLAVLERGMVLQAQGAWEESRRDLAAAEQGLEEIDFAHDAGGKLATYLYSASSANYPAPPVERVALNSFNILNYLALGRLEDAAVEARRFQVMRNYLETLDDPPQARFGAFLAGFVFEHLGEPERALRYYEEVLTWGPLDTLDNAVARVAARTRWRGPAVTSALERARGRGAGNVPAAADSGARPGARRSVANAGATSEILFVASLGRAPKKVAQRIPIGAAIGIAGTHITGNIDVLKHSILKVLVFPELVPVPSRVTRATLVVDGEEIQPELLTNLGNKIMTSYDKIKPVLMGQALSRLIARAAVAEGVRIAGREADGGSQLLGLLLALGTEAAMVGLDKPDTRSWSFLPDKVLVARVPVAPGWHEVEIRLDGGGGTQRRRVEVPANSYGAVIVTEPR